MRSIRLGLQMVALAVVALSTVTSAAEESVDPSSWAPVVAEGATLKKISSQFEFTEGPAADADGNVYFTDQPDDKIWKYDTSGRLSVFLKEAGRSNGLYFDADRNLIAASDAHGQLWSIAPDGDVTVLIDNADGHQMNGPNDLWIAPGGGIYFSDPYYQRHYWLRDSKDQPGEDVFYLAPGADNARKVVDHLIKPNGLIGTPDGKKLYVSDFGDNQT